MIIVALLLLINAEQGWTSPVDSNAVPPGHGSAKYVILIGIDGLGSVHLDNATHLLPTMARFYTEGSVALPGSARSELITVSALNWAAVITGMSPVQSGILENSWTPPADSGTASNGMRSVGYEKCKTCNGSTEELLSGEYMDSIKTIPTINIKDCTTVLYDPPAESNRLPSVSEFPEPMWTCAKQQDPSLKVAVVYSWQWIIHLTTDDSVDWSFNCNGNDAKCTEKMVDLIINKSPQLAFLHLDSVDHSGHTVGFGSPEYYSALKEVDTYIGQILTALEDAGILNSTLVMVTSDHGGYRRVHGHFNKENIFVPALFLGPGVRESGRLSQFISMMDFAPTALNALGLQAGEHMRGRVIWEMYLKSTDKNV